MRMMMHLEIESAVNGILTVSTVLLLYSATASWVQSGLNKKVVAKYVVTVVLVALAIELPITKAHMVEKLYSMFHDHDNVFEKLPNGQNLDCNLRVQYKKMLLSQRFIDDGEIGSYKDCQGNEHLFEPSQQDVETLKSGNALKTVIEVRKHNNFVNIGTWFIIVLFSVLYGWLDGRKTVRARYKKVSDEV
jgi:hypothetical protein